ncbi:MAG TPA: tetratricopeptide repeat protein [Nitrospira sp.]|nr:tetratricopeptide repeat protein [Nitrospira sp.]
MPAGRYPFRLSLRAEGPLFFLYLVIVVVLCPNAAFASSLPVSARTLSGHELLRIGEIHDVQNHFQEALTYYEKALDSFRLRKQRKDQAIVLTKIASIYERQGKRQEAAREIRQALALFPKTPDTPVHADALFLSGRVALWLGNRQQGAELLQQAQERYRRSKNGQALGSVTLQAGILKVTDGSPDEGLREIQQVVDDARARGDHDQTLAGLMALGDANYVLDRPERSRSLYEESIALLDQRPHAGLEARVRIRLAALNSAMCREEHGIDSAKRAVTLCQSLRDVSGEAAAWALLGALHEALGHGPEAEDAFRRALAIYRQQMLSVHPIRPSSPPSATVPEESRSPARP